MHLVAFNPFSPDMEIHILLTVLLPACFPRNQHILPHNMPENSHIIFDFFLHPIRWPVHKNKLVTTLSFIISVTSMYLMVSTEQQQKVCNCTVKYSKLCSVFFQSGFYLSF